MSWIIKNGFILLTLILGFISQTQACECGQYPVRKRTENGWEKDLNVYTSMAYLSKVGTKDPLCIASIIAQKYALTTASCGLIESAVSGLRLTVGDQDRSGSRWRANHDVANILKHPEYKQGQNRHDIAIITTTTDISWTRGVGPICLPTAGMSTLVNSYAEAAVYALGYGASSNKLQDATFTVMNNKDCQTSLKETIYNDELCTLDDNNRYKDSCQIYAGGPAIRRGYNGMVLMALIGSSGACGQKVNTRVSAYVPWINENTGSAGCSKI